MKQPERHQRSRQPGWRKPEGAVIVDRTSKEWGNPYVVTITICIDDAPIKPRRETQDKFRRDERALARDMFAQYAKHRLAEEPDWLEPLRGKDLVCFCKEGEACHADVLLALANGRPWPPQKPKKPDFPADRIERYGL